MEKQKIKIDYICSNLQCNKSISFYFTEDEVDTGMHQLFYNCKNCKHQLRLLTFTPCQCRICRFARDELEE